MLSSKRKIPANERHSLNITLRFLLQLVDEQEVFSAFMEISDAKSAAYQQFPSKYTVRLSLSHTSIFPFPFNWN